jgi:hypothetical protein
MMPPQQVPVVMVALAVPFAFIAKIYATSMPNSSHVASRLHPY